MLGITPSAVSQHLKVLKDAGLVTVQIDGARRIYHLSGDGLVELRAYLDALWDEVLAAFQAAAGEEAINH